MERGDGTKSSQVKSSPNDRFAQPGPDSAGFNTEDKSRQRGSKVLPLLKVDERVPVSAGSGGGARRL